MITPDIQGTITAPSSTPARSGDTDMDEHGFSFHDLLSAMNPLQYLPVVGTLYRAITGDVIPEALRRAGSFVVSGLLGGPIGLALNVVSTIAEKLSGIDPEKIVAAEFTASPSATGAPPGVSGGEIASGPVMTGRQRAAYGEAPTPPVVTEPDDPGAADRLNARELVRLDKAAAAYAAYQTIRPNVAAAEG